MLCKDTRNVTRDNRDPLIPTPKDPSDSLPTPTDEPIRNEIARVQGVPTGPPSVRWRSR